MPRVQSGSIFFAGKRLAVMQNITYRINTNDTQEVADGGVFNTDGISMSEVDCDTIVPIGGVGVDVVAKALNHEDFDLTLGIVDGKIHELKECRAKTLEFAFEKATGKMTGKFSFHGPAPTVTG